MTDAVEAERFNRELDLLLAGGKPEGAPDPELARDLALAQRIAASDLSRQSRVRRSLWAGLQAPGAQPGPAGLFGVRPRVWATCAALATMVLAPLAMHFISAPEDGTHTVGGFDRKSAFESAAPYEEGISGIAPGGLIGSAPQTVTPLNTRDPGGFATSDPAGDGSVPVLNTEAYSHNPENGFRRTADHPLSTFSIDVDRASYANARRFLGRGRLPPPDSVRIEEFINYFRYDYPEPQGEHPFSITTEVAACPWEPKHKLVRIGLKGKSVPKGDLPPGNLVFLVDSSGSMTDEDKLPLLKRSLRLLVEQLRSQDRISLVTYAGGAGLVLPSTPGSDKAAILAAIDGLGAGGSTAGGAGIELAYKVAAENLIRGGNNRVLLATDGDFNVGVTSEGELVRLIEEKRGRGVFLSVLGFGTGNYKDATMEKLADKGDGNYAYIDDILEARKVLVEEMGGTLLAIAKDVKLQVEFNPARAAAYRLIGYENRALSAEDFNDDKKDAGELGAGHTVTALYEVIPPGVNTPVPGVDPLKYQRTEPAPDAASSELLTVKLRYKKPDEDASKLLDSPLEDQDRPWAEASEDLRFAASAAGFGMLLRGSRFKGDLSYAEVGRMAGSARGKDEGGYRAEFEGLVERARLLDKGAR